MSDNDVNCCDTCGCVGLKPAEVHRVGCPEIGKRNARIRAAEKAVLDAAEAWEDSPTSPSREVALQAAVRALREARKS